MLNGSDASRTSVLSFLKNSTVETRKHISGDFYNPSKMHLSLLEYLSEAVRDAAQPEPGCVSVCDGPCGLYAIVRWSRFRLAS